MSDFLEKQGVAPDDLAHILSPVLYSGQLPQVGETAIGICGARYVVKHGSFRSNRSEPAPLHASCGACAHKAYLAFLDTNDLLIDFIEKHPICSHARETVERLAGVHAELFGHSIPGLIRMSLPEDEEGEG